MDTFPTSLDCSQGSNLRLVEVPYCPGQVILLSGQVVLKEHLPKGQEDVASSVPGSELLVQYKGGTIKCLGHAWRNVGQADFFCAKAEGEQNFWQDFIFPVKLFSKGLVIFYGWGGWCFFYKLSDLKMWTPLKNRFIFSGPPPPRKERRKNTGQCFIKQLQIKVFFIFLDCPPISCWTPSGPPSKAVSFFPDPPIGKPNELISHCFFGIKSTFLNRF